MNRKILTRILAVLLAAVCLASLVACGKKDTGKPLPDPDKAKEYENNITGFVKKNQKPLNAVAEKLMAADGLSYYYFFKEGDRVLVDEMVMEDGSYVRYTYNDPTTDALAALGYTGEVAHSSSSDHRVVSFLTHQDKNVLFYFVYCPNEDSVRYISHGFFSGETEVTVTPIVGNWYYVQAW